ncbi:Uncharacterised protein [BD1-7 clade bacterium]|uniref:Glycosyltransferase RgtA/B/C/D-like domain-containing protein n=1 Tax=BD1-7 clade bacterium TaxID=2029982 RepID=A0A5S9PH47_9GAMM|nr:Uncharacterised protein [BD1-7 clade bacterium]CAA0103287.1 Uncharacterised protein [BD1-7 clade bacterium]
MRIYLPFFLLALSIRLVLASQDIAYLDRLFLPDDTYYTLAITQNIFFNQLPSTNGEAITSGFQPLITLCQLPIFHFFDDLDTAVKASIYLSAVIGSLSTILLGVFLTKAISTSTARFGMFLFAISPAILINDLNGLETSLAGFFCLAVSLLFYLVVSKPSALHACLLGVACSLALVSRIDTALLILLIGFGLLALVGIRWTSVVVLTALVAILPWWIYLYLEFGSIVPESGKAVRQILEVTPHKNLAPVFSLYKLTDVFAIQSLGMSAGLAQRLVILVFIGYCLFAVRRARPPAALAIVLASAIPLVLFYTFYLPAYWFFERYFYWVYVLLIMLLAVVLTHIASKHIKFAIIGFCVLAAGANIHLFFSKPEQMPALNFFGPKGYRDPALAVLAKTPDQSHIAAMQSGALNYYSGDTVRVTNLDGVVNRDAYLATKNGTMYQYLVEIEVTHFADWHLNRNLLFKETQQKINADCSDQLHHVKHGKIDTSLYDIKVCLND